MSDKYGYIGLESLLDFCSNQKDHCVTPNDFMRMNRVKIDERPRGEWVPQDEFDEIFKCSNCGVEMRMEFNFCPNCGAPMNEEAFRKYNGLECYDYDEGEAE